VITKKQLNKFLRKWNVELHGVNYMQALRAESMSINEFDFFRTKIRNCTPVIFDVGANRRVTVQRFLQVFPEARIFAFEPLPGMFQELSAKFSNNSNIGLYEFGITDRKSSSTFYVNHSLDTSSLLPGEKTGLNSDKSVKKVGEIIVNTITLDEFAFANNIRKIDILKLDIQGSELSALKGAVNLLRNGSIGVIYCETYFIKQYQDQPLFLDIAKFLSQYNFKVQDIYNRIYGNGSIAWCDTIFIKSDLV